MAEVGFRMKCTIVPVSFWGQSKLYGEERIRMSGELNLQHALYTTHIEYCKGPTVSFAGHAMPCKIFDGLV